MREVPAGATQVAQAVFTSIRSPMGQGYRIVAASAGISPEEKRQIVQRAPSHGNLCDPSANATALASFELGSGRHCIFLSRNAGVEQTARGGRRIHTHVLVMEPAVFRRFHCDPLKVEQAALPAISTDLPPGPSARLGPLLLSHDTDGPVGRDPDPTPPPPAGDTDRLLHILSAILCERCLLVIGAPAPQQTLRWVFAATPTAARERLSLSHGLKLSPSRRFRLVFADAGGSQAGPNRDRERAARIIRDDEIDLFHWESPPAPARGPFDTWLRFVRRRWESGRREEMNRLSSRLTQEGSAPALERIATLCTDIEQVSQADAVLLDQLTRKYTQLTPASDAHARLLANFQDAAQTRKAALLRAQQEAAAEAEVPVIGLA